MSDKKYIRNWLYFLFVSVYYSQLYDGQYIGFDGMIRIFAGLAVGQLLFDFVELIKDKEIKTPVRVFCQIAEFFFAYYIIDKLLARGDILRPVTHSSYTYNIMLFSFLGLAFILGRKSYSHKLSSRLISFLGQIAFPLYLFHVPIMFIIHNYVGEDFGFKKELILSSAVSLVFSAIIYFIISSRKSHSK